MNINSTNSSSTYTNSAYSSKGFSGMYSGIDTESLVKSMLSNIQNKIDKQNQTKQVLTWKQELYRDIISEVNSFQSKFLDLTSKTSLRLNSFFDSAKASSSSSAVSVTANSNSADTEFKMQVARLATAASVTSSSAGSGKIEFTPGSNFQYDRSINIKIGTNNINVDLTGGSQELTSDEILSKINSEYKRITGDTNDIAALETKTIYKDDKGKVYNLVDGEYKDEKGNVYNGDISALTSETLSKIKFNATGEFEISGSSAGMAALGLSGNVKSKSEDDGNGNTVHKLESGNLNERYTKTGNVNGTVDVTLDGVKKTISVSEKDGAAEFEKKLQSAFGTSVTIGPDGISVAGKGRCLTMSANAETMKAMGFSEGTTVVSTNTLRSDKIGSLVSGLADDTEYTFNVNGTEIKYTAKDTISSIMNKINSSNAGVKMTYNDLNNTFKLESKSTGAGYDVKIEGDSEGLFEKLGFSMTGGSLNNVKAGQNAVVNINGTTVERSSNDFTYNGIDISLKSTTGTYEPDGDYFDLNADGTFKVSAGGTENVAEIKTSRNTDKIMDALKSFVEEYNTMIEKLNKLTHQKATYKKYPPLTEAQKKEMSEKEIELWEEKAKEGLLRNDRDISSFLSSMRSAMYSTGGTGIVLSNIGIDSSSNWQDYGKLSIDEDKLKKALETNAESVQKLFAGENGLAKRLSKACEDLANTSSGRPGALVSIAGVVGKGTEKNNEIQTKLDSITKKINSLNMLYEKRKTRYWKQFNAMETALSNTDSQSSWLSNFMSY